MRGEQAIEFSFDDLVALTDLCFQALPVQYGDVATVVINQSRFLQSACGLRDAFTSHTQHIGDQFLGDGQLVRSKPVEALQEPPAELLVHRMMPITDRRLSYLGKQRLGVMQQQMV